MADKIKKADLLRRIEALEAENRALRSRLAAVEAQRAPAPPNVAPWRPHTPWWERPRPYWQGGFIWSTAGAPVTYNGSDDAS